MPIFSLDNGRLTPADSTLRLDEELRAEAFIAVRDQVVELLARPIFPVAWLTETGRVGEDVHHTSLVALEPAGEIVTVDVLDTLDTTSLMESLSRAGRHSDISRGKLAGLYPRGTAAFRRDWDEFVAACPSRVEPGPRLIVLAFEVADEVRTALDSLLGAGVELFRVSLHDSRSGLLVSLDRMRPNEASFRALVQSLRAIATAGAARPEIAESASSAAEPAADEVSRATYDDGERPGVEPEEPVAPAKPDAAEAETDAADGPEAPAKQAEQVGVVEESKDEPVSEEPETASAEQAAPAEREAETRPERVKDADSSGGEDPAEILRVGSPLRHGPQAAYVGDDGRSHWEKDAADQFLLGGPGPAGQGGSLTDDSWDPGSLQWPSVRHDDEPTELEQIVAQHGELDVHARSRRRRLNARAHIDSEGRFILEDGTAWPGPDEALEAILGRKVDGWKLWKTADGRRLSDLRP
ncbi:MAG: hypothetical protein Q4P33_09520 [Flaviflexus sp.]|nr:hypothetical protein [Flaviflexus sp.]